MGGGALLKNCRYQIVKAVNSGLHLLKIKMHFQHNLVNFEATRMADPFLESLKKAKLIALDLELKGQRLLAFYKVTAILTF